MRIWTLARASGEWREELVGLVGDGLLVGALEGDARVAHGRLAGDVDAVGEPVEHALAAEPRDRLGLEVLDHPVVAVAALVALGLAEDAEEHARLAGAGVDGGEHHLIGLGLDVEGAERLHAEGDGRRAGVDDLEPLEVVVLDHPRRQAAEDAAAEGDEHALAALRRPAGGHGDRVLEVDAARGGG